MKKPQHSGQRSQAGFSLLEILTVLSIGMVVTMTTLPNMMTAIASVRLHSSMTSLAGVLQNCRMLAVKENGTMSTHFAAQATGVVAYVKRANDANSLLIQDSQIKMEAPLTRVVAPSGPGAPAALDNTVLGFTPQTGDPSFNTTGLPCSYSGGNCPKSGFIYYFHDTRATGNSIGWAALSISPAGRLKKWYWNTSAWTD